LPSRDICRLNITKVTGFHVGPIPGFWGHLYLILSLALYCQQSTILDHLIITSSVYECFFVLMATENVAMITLKDLHFI
jgi:hypothetical protein